MAVSTAVRLIGAALLVSVAVACGTEPLGSPDGSAGSGNAEAEGRHANADGLDIDGWFDVLDSELDHVTGAEWEAGETRANVSVVCGPADGHEGWRLSADLAVAEDVPLDPPDDTWEETDLGGSLQPHVWRHRDYPNLLIRATEDKRQADVEAATYGIAHDAWDHSDDMPDTHPRVHPRALDPSTGEPVGTYCG